MDNMIYRDISLEDVMFSSFPGDEQHLIKQEEGSLVLGPVDGERSFQNQLSVSGQVRTLPVEEQRLDLLHAEQKSRVEQSRVQYNRVEMNRI